MSPFDKDDRGSFLKFLGTLAVPFVLLGVGAILVAAGAMALAAGTPSVIWLGLMVVGGVFAIAGIIGFLLIMMMADSSPF